MINKSLMNKSAALLSAALLASCSAVTAFAGSFDYSKSYALVDDAELFSATEYDGLKEKLESVGSKTGWQIVVYTSDEGVSSSEMDSYYGSLLRQESYIESDYVAFVIDDRSDSRIILTGGSAEKYFSDDRMDEMKSGLKPYISSADWYGASQQFADACQSFYNNGVPSDGSYNNVSSDSGKKEGINFARSFKKGWWIYLLIALAAGGIFIGVNAGRYTFNGKGGTYNLKENSTMQLLEKQDVFLGKTTTSTVIETSSSSGGSSGGGSHGSSGAF